MRFNNVRDIAEIDRDITATEREFRRRQPIPNPLSAEDWQEAWDKEPELSQRNNALFAERGAAQQERDQRAFEADKVSLRRKPRTKKCPTCGGAGRVAIAETDANGNVTP